MRRRARQASPVAEPPCSHGAAAIAQGAADAEVMVRRSRIAPCVTFGLCSGFLRDAAAIAECLHPFCRECIVEEFTVTDKTINRCPKCDIDLGCNPLKKLRADHSLQHIRSLIFPAKSKRRKMEEISPLQPPFVPLPSPSNQAHEVDHPANKADAHLMVEEPTNAETETEADERLWTEPSLEKFIASSPHTAVAPVAEPEWLDKCRNRQRDEQREEASSAFNVEPQGAIQGYGIEEFESEHHGLLELDQQASPQERNELTDEVDPWTIAVERSKTRMTTEGWRTRRTTTKERSTEGCMNELANEIDPWTVAVETSKTRMTTDEGWITDGWTAAVKEHVSSLTTQVEAEGGRARSLEDEVRRLRRELEAARASASEANARRSVAEQNMMEAERAAEVMAHAFNRALDNLKEYGLLPVDPPPDRSVAEYAAGFGHVVADCLDRLRDAIADRIVEDVRDATTVTAEYVLACCLSRDPSFRMEMVLEGIVAADEVEEHALLRHCAAGDRGSA